MFGNLFFGLTVVSYAALAVFNLLKVTATGERLIINVEAVCRVLDTPFKGNAAVFRENMVKLQEVLAITPRDRSSKEDNKWYVECLNLYHIAVKNWLDSN